MTTKQIFVELKENEIKLIDILKFKFQWHEASDVEPLQSKSDYLSTKAEVELHGEILKPVLIYNNKIVDGRHRQKIAIELKIPLPVVYLKGTYTLEVLQDFVRTIHMGRNKTNNQKLIQAYRYKKTTANVEWEDAAKRYGVAVSTLRKIVTLYNLLKKAGLSKDFEMMEQDIFMNKTLLPSTYAWVTNPTSSLSGALIQLNHYLSEPDEDEDKDPTEIDNKLENIHQKSVILETERFKEIIEEKDEQLSKYETMITELIEKIKGLEEAVEYLQEPKPKTITRDEMKAWLDEEGIFYDDDEIEETYKEEKGN